MNEPAPSTPAASRLQCQQCGAGLRLLRYDKTVVCPYCDSSNVVSRPPQAGIPSPAFVVPFARPEGEVHALVARWGQQLPWYVPEGFKRLRVEELKPVYVPAYLFAGEVDARWSASVGYRYVDTRGNKVRRGEEWREVLGTLRMRLANILVSASHRLTNKDLARVEPYDFGRIARYSDAAIAGWPAEEAARSPRDTDEELDGEIEEQLQGRVANLVPGEMKKAPSVSWKLHDEKLDLLLVPVWSMLVRYSPTGAPVRVLVNGQTGKVWGEAPVSKVKVALAVLAGLGFALGWFALRKLGVLHR